MWMGNVFRRHCPFLLKFLGDNYQLSIINYKLTQERYSTRNTFLAFRASCRIRTNDPEITNHVLWPTELKRQSLWRAPTGWTRFAGAKIRPFLKLTKLSQVFFQKKCFFPVFLPSLKITPYYIKYIRQQWAPHRRTFRSSQPSRIGHTPRPRCQMRSTDIAIMQNATSYTTKMHRFE